LRKALLFLRCLAAPLAVCNQILHARILVTSLHISEPARPEPKSSNLECGLADGSCGYRLRMPS